MHATFNTNKGPRNTAGLGLVDVPSKRSSKQTLSFSARRALRSVQPCTQGTGTKGSQLLASRAVQPAPAVVVSFMAIAQNYC